MIHRLIVAIEDFITRFSLPYLIACSLMLCGGVTGWCCAWMFAGAWRALCWGFGGGE